MHTIAHVWQDTLEQTVVQVSDLYILADLLSNMHRLSMFLNEGQIVQLRDFILVFVRLQFYASFDVDL